MSAAPATYNFAKYGGRYMRIILAAIACLIAAASPCNAEPDDKQGGTSILLHGAKCNGVHDDTASFRRAMRAAPSGGVILVPTGKCVLSDTVIITASKPLSIAGTGRGSQVFQRSNKTLFQLEGVNAVFIRDLYLGSAATSAGTSLLKLINSHHNRIDNVTMLGSYYGLHLQGSLLNNIVNLRSGINFGGFFQTTSPNQTWVMAERFNNISANANTFVAPALEGGVNGIFLHNPTIGEGSLTITGGTIEGVSGTALRFENTFLPSSVSGVHFEANGVADIIMQNSSNIRVSAVLSIKDIRLEGDTRNVQVSDSIVEKMFIASTTKRVQLQNITTAIATCGPTIGPGHIDNQNPSTIMVNIGNYCGGE